MYRDQKPTERAEAYAMLAHFADDMSHLATDMQHEVEWSEELRINIRKLKQDIEKRDEKIKDFQNDNSRLISEISQLREQGLHYYHLYMDMLREFKPEEYALGVAEEEDVDW